MRLLHILFVGLALGVAPTAPALAQKGGEATSEVRGDLVEAFLNTLPATFQVDGLNADGTAYSGTAQMSFNWNSMTATIVWQVGADTYQGQGPLDNGRLVIDWGDTSPVIYTVTPDLSLSGSWANGTASETLTPIP
ncbi:MAG: hypothetical protein RIC24_01045 [Hyphomicrobiales bacterium]|jgi:hypothetical protein